MSPGNGFKIQNLSFSMVTVSQKVTQLSSFSGDFGPFGTMLTVLKHHQNMRIYFESCIMKSFCNLILILFSH